MDPEQDAREQRVDEICADPGQALRQGVDLLGAGLPEDRALGCDVLGRVGSRHPRFAEPVVTALLALADRETEGCVLAGLAHALEFLNDPRSVPALITLADHPDPAVRVEVPVALACIPGATPDGAAVRTLIALTRDEDDEVRNWATFALGYQAEADSPAIRAALWARTTDPYRDARAEGVHGLARRHDPRAVPLVAELLDAEDGAHLFTFEAAQYLGAPELLPHLDAYEPDSPGVEAATAACDPLLRARAESAAWAVLCAAHELCPELDLVLYQERYATGLTLCPAALTEAPGYDAAALLARAEGDPRRAAELVAEDAKDRHGVTS